MVFVDENFLLFFILNINNFFYNGMNWFKFFIFFVFSF